MEITPEAIEQALRLYGRYYHIQLANGGEEMAVNYRDARRIARQGNIRPVYCNWLQVDRETKVQVVFAGVAAMAMGQQNIGSITIHQPRNLS